MPRAKGDRERQWRRIEGVDDAHPLPGEARAVERGEELGSVGRKRVEQGVGDAPTSAFIGLEHGKIRFTPLAQFPDLIEPDLHRPREQSWMALRPLAKVMAKPGLPQP